MPLQWNYGRIHSNTYKNKKELYQCGVGTRNSRSPSHHPMLVLPILLSSPLFPVPPPTSIPTSSFWSTSCGTLQPHPRRVEKRVRRKSSSKPCSAGSNMVTITLFWFSRPEDGQLSLTENSWPSLSRYLALLCFLNIYITCLSLLHSDSLGYFRKSIGLSFFENTSFCESFFIRLVNKSHVVGNILLSSLAIPTLKLVGSLQLQPPNLCFSSLHFWLQSVSPWLTALREGRVTIFGNNPKSDNKCLDYPWNI